jgi:hypothetical protein
MLGMALLDWVATRLYARRQVRRLASERLRILRSALGKKPPDRGDSEESLER